MIVLGDNVTTELEELTWNMIWLDWLCN